LWYVVGRNVRNSSGNIRIDSAMYRRECVRIVLYIFYNVERDYRQLTEVIKLVSGYFRIILGN
jgi:hypothetical protein